MTKYGLSAVLRRVRRVVARVTGGFLPGPLSVRSTLATAVVAAVVLVAFGGTAVGFVVGLILAAAVWYMEMVEALTARVSALAEHSRLSISYIAWLCVGVAGLYANRADRLVWLEWVCLGVLAVTGWLVSAQPGFLKVTPLAGAANLKHDPRRARKPRFGVNHLLLVVYTTVALSAVLAAITVVTPWVTLAITAAASGVVAWSVAQAWRYGQHARWGVIREIDKLKPGALVPYGGTATYQAEMWYPYLDQLGTPYYIISLTERAMTRLAKNTTVPVVTPAAEETSEISSLIPDSVGIAYYPHNSNLNTLFRNDRRMSHVFVHHGDGDKIASAGKRSAAYDYLFVAGQAAIDRYANSGVTIPLEKFKIVGRPQTAAIQTDRTPISHKTHPVVLYAPTWQGKSEGKNYSSLPMGPDIIAELLDRGVTVIFRPHPSSRSSREHRELIDRIQGQLQHDFDVNGRQHMWGEPAEKDRSVADVANEADAMIADVSGIITDFMQSGKPYAMGSPRWTADEFRNKFPTSKGAYVIDESSGSIGAALDAMLGDDPLADYRWQRRSYYLGGFEGRESVDRFLEESRKLIAAATSQGSTT